MPRNPHDAPAIPETRDRSGSPANVKSYPWYDSIWLTKYAKAKAALEALDQKAATRFVNAFHDLHAPPAFRPIVLEQVIDRNTLEEIRQVVRTLKPEDLALHEARMFRRFVAHSHPSFTKLHKQLLPLMSRVVGQPLDTAYSFLSLYGPKGVCPPHLDSPQSKWTLDLCIDQSEPWPIHFSQVCPWPEPGDWPTENWEDAIKNSPSLRFSSVSLKPGQAVVFSGSSQWHYRETMPESSGRQFCTLLFLHFIPRGTSELLDAANWGRLFGVPESAGPMPIAKFDAVT